MKFLNLMQNKSKFKEYIETALRNKGAKAVSDQRNHMAATNMGSQNNTKTFSNFVEANKPAYPLFHKTYTSAIQAAIAYAEKQGYTTNDDNRFDVIGTGPGRPKGGATVKHQLDLYKNGKLVKNRNLNIQVHDMEGNSYELNAYIQ